jgi:hypothetical protein
LEGVAVPVPGGVGICGVGGLVKSYERRTGVKRNYHTLDNRGKVNERKLAEFLSQNGQHLLPMVELVEQSRLAVDELVDTVGRVTVQTVTSTGCSSVSTA